MTVSLATHTDPRRAASKAILEQAHVGPYLTSLLPKTRVPASIHEVLTLEDHASYYFPPERQAAFAFLRNGKKTVKLGELPDAGPPTLATCAARIAAIGSRVAYVDVTSPDVMLSPFRVARAVGLDLLPIHFGSRFRRLGNPRLKKLLGKKIDQPPSPSDRLRRAQMQVLLCGTHYGANYVEALWQHPSGLRLGGILSRGSARSVQLARQLSVPHYDSLEQVPPGAIEAAIVAVGGAGAALATSLLERGIPVLAEHPVEPDALEALLALAARERRVFHLNSHFGDLETIVPFVHHCAELRQRTPLLFLHAQFNPRTAFSLIEILGRAIGALEPFSIGGPAPLPAGHGVRRAARLRHRQRDPRRGRRHPALPAGGLGRGRRQRDPGQPPGDGRLRRRQPAARRNLRPGPVADPPRSHPAAPAALVVAARPARRARRPTRAAASVPAPTPWRSTASPSRSPAAPCRRCRGPSTCSASPGSGAP